MKTKKAAAPTREFRKETLGSDGPRRYTLRPSPYEISEASGESWSGDFEPHPAYGIRTRAPYAAANRAQPARAAAQFVPQAAAPKKEKAFPAPGGGGAGVRPKVTLPREFIEWAERQGFAPADAARFVLVWFCEREKVDTRRKVQYTCTHTTWPTNAPKTKKM